MARRLALLAVASAVLGGGAWYLLSGSGPDFPGEAALEHVRAVVACGERQPESAGSRCAREKILSALRAGGVEAEEKSYKMRTPMPDPQTGAPREITFTNVVARVKGKSDATIAWGTHYDTPAITGQTIVGANDGASGIGVLIELAKRLQGSSPAMTHVFLFLDGEEKLGDLPWNHQIGDLTANACFGSRAQAQEWARENRLPRAFVLLDMIGDADLQILWETQYATVSLKNPFERAAREQGLDGYFFKYQMAVNDDHAPFAHYDVPTIDLIDFRYGPPHPERGGGAYWHSADDTMDKLSAKSLAIVGAVCWAAIPLLEKKFL
ncbi:MAG: M28 family peptidase [Planctomycetes bacterium]|nr:M28 family peptidase [Planctomycetota bacterium]